MMSWVLPSALAIAGVACVATIAAHLIARDRPVAEPLPTARFIPDRRIHARTTSIALSDLLLLALRLAAIIAIGLAVAGPVVAVARGRVARIVLVDRSRSVASVGEVRDSLRVLGANDVVVVFDSAARPPASSRSLDSLQTTNAVGSLSAALAAAHANAARLATRADSIDVTLISPLSVEELDDATPSIRALWPGRIRLVRVRAKKEEAATAQLELPPDTDDPVVAGLSLAPGTYRRVAEPPSHRAAESPSRRVPELRLVRGRPGSADSTWAKDSGHVLVHWPASDSGADWPRRQTIDAIGGVASSTGAFVARLPRLWALQGGRAIARWTDGEPAAVERPLGAGCVREVAVLVDPASDVTLHQPFRDFARALLSACGGARAFQPLDAAALSRIAGKGPLAAANAFRAGVDEPSRFTPWLLALGAALLLAELALRRTRRTAT